MRLATWGGSRLRSPRSDCFVGKPDGQAASSLQRRVILGAVRDPIPGLWDVMAVFGMVFEGHGTVVPGS
jgi:hypothetical protein